MVKMAFGIEVTGDSVNYVKSNKDKVIECISDESNTYKSIESYDASNWNYLLLVNVLNQVKHSDQHVNAQLIQDTATLIAKNTKYSKCTTQLNNAVHDITEYFNELELYGYLERAKSTLINWRGQKYMKYVFSSNNTGYFEETIRNTQDRINDVKSLSNLFNNAKIDCKNSTDEVIEVSIKSNIADKTMAIYFLNTRDNKFEEYYDNSQQEKRLNEQKSELETLKAQKNEIGAKKTEATKEYRRAEMEKEAIETSNKNKSSDIKACIKRAQKSQWVHWTIPNKEKREGILRICKELIKNNNA